MARTIKSIHLGTWIEKTTGKGRGIGDVPDEGHQAQMRKGKSGWGNKVHCNGTPTLSDGHVMEGNNTGDPENDDEAWKEIPKVNDGYIFTEWWWDGVHMGGPIDLGSLEDNYGCTPTVKAKKDAEDKSDHELRIQQVYAKGTPQEVRSNFVTRKIS
jgi:hypothetical protein